MDELDPSAVQNGSRSWSLPPRLIDLGQRWMRDEEAGIPFDNTQLNPDDFKEMLGTYRMEDLKGVRGPRAFVPIKG